MAATLKPWHDFTGPAVESKTHNPDPSVAIKLPFLIAGTFVAAMALAASDPSTKASGAEASSVQTGRPRQAAPATKPAYIVFIRERTLDRAELEAYWKEAPASLEGQPIKVLSGYGPHEVWEGDSAEGVVIAEFPSMEAARAWYHSPAYQKAREHCLKGAVYRGILVEATTPGS